MYFTPLSCYANDLILAIRMPYFSFTSFLSSVFKVFFFPGNTPFMLNSNGLLSMMRFGDGIDVGDDGVSFAYSSLLGFAFVNKMTIWTEVI